MSISRRTNIAIVLISALVTVVILMLAVRLPFYIKKHDEAIIVTEADGIYNLSDISDNAASYKLLPGAFFYPEQLLNPVDIEQAEAVPLAEYNEVNGADYLTQRFVIILPDSNKVYRLQIEVSGRHAMRIYANGAFVGSSGQVGISKETSEVWENNTVCYASPTNGRIDLIIQLSQFYHFRSGARIAELNLSDSAYYDDPWLSTELKGMILIGAFAGQAIVLLLVFFLLSRTPATLYFAFGCLAVALREAVQSQAWTYFPISGSQSFVLEYLSVVLITVFVSLYLGQYIQNHILRVIQYLSISVSIIFGIVILFGDSTLYTSLISYYQLFLVVLIIPGVGGLFWSMRDLGSEQGAALYGIAVFFLAAVSDIVMYNNIFGYQHPKTPVTETSMLVFVLAQTVSLFLMNNRILTEAKQAEHQLTLEKAALEKVNRLKTEFLGNVSHELKTPLTVMSGYAQSTRQMAENQDSIDKSEIKRRMKLISSEAERLSLMVGQILDVTRMEEGQMTMERKRCYLDEVIYKTVETHYPLLNKNNNQLNINIEHALPAVYADPARISQVIVNLVSNAVRFTHDGQIRIDVNRDGDHIEICVRDTGSGISEDKLPHVFDRYNSIIGKQGSTGTGLGLFICKHIIEQHEGKISIASVFGEGTSVCFKLPVDETSS